MTVGLSRRCHGIVQAEIRAMSIECERAAGINLAQGVCNVEVSALVREGAHKAIDESLNSYTRYDGVKELRQAIARKVRDFNGLQADPESEIIVTAGSTGAFYCACLALLDPGDEVILFEPYYGYHLNTLLAVGAVPRFLTLQAGDWSFERAELEKAIGAKTKAIVVNTPANPSGKVFSRHELDWIAEEALRHDLFVLTDEIYEHFVYDGGAHLSPGAINEIADRTITISGFSKVFSVTGWRIGYSVSASRWAQMIGYINDLVYVCAPAPLQYGILAGLQSLEAGFYRDLAFRYQGMRDRLCAALQAGGLTPYVPAGAYYVLADASRLAGATSKEKAMTLLARAGVASVPGGDFYWGKGGENLLRFCFAKPDDELEEACRRLERLA